MKALGSILFIDDEYINQKFFELIFKNQFIIYSAYDGDEGLALLRNHREITIVVSDYRMPGMDGIEFIREAKKEFADKHYFLLTGYETNIDIHRAIDEKIITRSFKKPFDEEELWEQFKACVIPGS